MPGKTIKQPNNYSCFACCMAMATGKSLDYVYGSIGHDGSEIIPGGQHPDKRRAFSLQEAVIYFAKHDIYFGHVYLFDDGLRMTPDDKISGLIKPRLSNALLDVVSETLPPPCLHVVYWDGEDVRDPNPIPAGDKRRLEEYTIKGWWSLTPF